MIQRSVYVFLLFGLLLSTESSLGQIEKLKSDLTQAPHDSVRTRLLLELGWAFMSVSNDSAFFYVDQANKLASKRADTLSLAKSHNYFGILQFRTGNPAKAIRQYRTSMGLYEKIEDWNGVSSGFNNIGIVYSDLRDFEKAIEQYRRFVDLALKVGNDLKVAKGYYNLVVTFTEMRQADSAKHYLAIMEAFQRGKEKEFLSVDAAKAAILLLEEDFEKAIFHTKRWDERVGLDDFDKVEYYILLLQAYRGNKDNKTALQMAEEAERLCVKLGSTADLMRIKKRKSAILYDLGRTDDAYSELGLYNQLKDSLDNENGVVQMVELFNEYESALVEKELLAKNQIIEQQEQKRKSAALFWTTIVISGSFVFFISLWFLFKNHKKNLILNNQNKEINEQRGRVLSSIKYAERIQNAILNPNSAILSEFRESFVFNRPRDIVSGDFFWTGKVNEFVYIAVVDCTGHGVPGAMMSMVGHGMLTKIINEGKFTQPAEILKELDCQILSGLSQRSEGITVQDGMDISLVRLSKRDNKLMFAGACQNLLVFNDGQLHEYRGTPYSIGGGEGNKESYFDQTDVPYASGTSVFLFSDGFPDQFGGKDGKKFGKQAFFEMLSELNRLDLREGEAFLNDRFQRWSGQEKQIDDVLVVGFSL